MKRIYLWLISLLSGILLAASWPTGGFAPLAFFALVPLFWVENYVLEQQKHRDAADALLPARYRKKNPTQPEHVAAQTGQEGKPQSGKYRRYHVFLYSFSAFLLWNVLTTWWIFYSTPAAVLAFVANAALMGGTFSLFHYTCRHFFKKGLRWTVLFIYWIGFEHFHHHWDIAWPWLTLGNVFATRPSWVQWYEITGPFGGSLWILACNVAFLYLILNRKTARRKACILTTACLIFVPIAASLVRYFTYREKGVETEVAVVQPNIDPYTEQFNLSPLESTLKMLNLAQSRMTDETRFIVTPESMIQEYVWEEDLPYNSPSVRLIHTFLQQWPQAQLIAGISSYSRVAPCDSNQDGVRRRHFTTDPGQRFYKAHNTVITLSADPEMRIPLHHKSRLTPGVEIMPFAGKLKFIEKMAVNLGGTVGTLGVEDGPNVFVSESPLSCKVIGGSYAGKDHGEKPECKQDGPSGIPDHSEPSGPQETGIDGNGKEFPCIRFSDIICYESVFSDYVASCVNAGAELLFVSTNDGWWKDTPGHRQHAAYARLRAVENRRDIARSANTGISCFIDQKGNVYQATNYWEPACIRQKLFANKKMTFYSKYGSILGRSCLPLALFFILLTFVYRLFPSAWHDARRGKEPL